MHAVDMLQLRLLQTLWLNHAVTTLWPFYNKAVAKLVLEQAKPQIDEAIKPVSLCLYIPDCDFFFFAYAHSCHRAMFNRMRPCSMLLRAAGTAVCRHTSPHMGGLQNKACLACSTLVFRRPLSMLPCVQLSFHVLLSELSWLAAPRTAPLLKLCSEGCHSACADLP